MDTSRKICPMGAEKVKGQALVCRYCAHRFDSAPTAPHAHADASTIPQQSSSVSGDVGAAAIFVLPLLLVVVNAVWLHSHQVYDNPLFWYLMVAGALASYEASRTPSAGAQGSFASNG